MMKSCASPSTHFPEAALFFGGLSLLLALLFASLGTSAASVFFSKALLWASLVSHVIFLWIYTCNTSRLPSGAFANELIYKLFKKVPLFFFVLNVLYVFFPFFVSDDAVRHIHDGYYLLQGVDVYLQRPLDLPPLEFLAGQRPNHPEFATIYLPFTQLLAVVGAMLNSRYGFLVLYHGLCTLAFSYFWRHALPFEKKRFFPILLSPWFVFLFAGHHADTLGLVLVLALWASLRSLFREPSFASPKKNQIFFLHSRFVAAFLWGAGLLLLPGLKPEGIFWSVFLFVYFAIKYFSQRQKVGDLRQVLVALRYIFVFAILGAFLCFLALAAFSALVLWRTEKSLAAFWHTVRIFTDWFVAYNPFPALLAFVWKDSSMPQILRTWRFLVLGFGGLLFFSYLFFLIMRKEGTAALISKAIFFTKNLFLQKKRLPSTFSHLSLDCLKGMFFRTSGVHLLMGLLLMSILSKGAWNPWYFSWFVPLLLLQRKRPHFLEYAFFTSLGLCYLPVVDLRFSGNWNMQEFYWALAFFWMLLFCIRIFFRAK